jgi:hypothetical protein
MVQAMAIGHLADVRSGRLPLRNRGIAMWPMRPRCRSLPAAWTRPCAPPTT